MFPQGPLEIPTLPTSLPSAPHGDKSSGSEAMQPGLVFPVPGSKSITNRALVLAALADGQTRLEGVLHSDDTRHMRAGLQALGVGILDDGPTSLRIAGGRDRLRVPAQPLFVGNSGTTVRFLAAVACLTDGPVTLVGDAAMARRPISDLVDGLRQLGVRVDCATGCPPLTVHGNRSRFSSATVRMRGDRSSQYFSALLMATGLNHHDVTIIVDGDLVSRPYIEITTRMIADFGGQVTTTGDTANNNETTDRANVGMSVPSAGQPAAPPPLSFRVHHRASYFARLYAIEPDASSASYAFALAAASGRQVTVPGLGPSALQGDYAFVHLLAEMGARVSTTAHDTTVDGTGIRLRGLDVDMHHISDTVMTLAAIAPICVGKTTIRNVANIRIKETDRLAATVAELRRLGQIVHHGDDWLSIEPAPITPAVVRTYADHRMAMSFAVLGAVRPGISIEDPSCVSKTYPNFWRDLAACYPAGPHRPDW